MHKRLYNTYITILVYDLLNYTQAQPTFTKFVMIKVQVEKKDRIINQMSGALGSTPDDFYTGIFLLFYG